jgi:16S rRNA processing protein RimM
MTEKKRYLEAGRIVNTHGVRGEVKIQPWADSPEFLKGFSRLYIDGKPYRLLSARVHKSSVIASLEDVDDVNAAMALRDKTVFIDRREARLPEGGYFIQDLIGAKVVTEDGAELGTLVEVLNMPASDVYVVRGEREILIPAVPQFIISRDIDEGVITVRMMEGL